MFRAYSRRVDRRVFMEIDRRLGERGDRTDPGKLKLFTESARGQTQRDYFAIYSHTYFALSRIEEYPFNYAFRFRSSVHSGNPENDIVQGDFFPGFSLQSPAVVVLSGWMEGLTDYTHLAHRVGLCGRNFWAMDLPYHARRAPQGTRSGELAITGDLVRTLACIRQAVVDVRTLVAALWELGVRDIVLVGFSLGAWIGSLTALVEKRVSGAVFVTPVVRPDELLLRSPLFSALREGVPEDYREHAFDRVNHLYLPAYGKPVVDPGRIHLIGSLDDPLATPDFIRELASHWGCEACILPGGHITLYLTVRMWRCLFSLLDI